MNVKKTRRLIEIAYKYAWGHDGDADLRDEFRAIYNLPSFKFVGTFLYQGNNQFKWERVRKRPKRIPS